MKFPELDFVELISLERPCGECLKIKKAIAGEIRSPQPHARRQAGPCTEVPHFGVKTVVVDVEDFLKAFFFEPEKAFLDPTLVIGFKMFQFFQTFLAPELGSSRIRSTLGVRNGSKGKKKR